MTRRHWLAVPSADGWSAVLAARPDLAVEPLLARWALSGFPLVRRRAVPGDPPGLVPLGLPLPPSEGKRRIAVTMPADALQDSIPPPRLADARSSAPDAWQETITRLLHLAPDTRCFGSLAWQHLTGLSYLSPESDLDLLWEWPCDPEALLTGLTAIAQAAPMRIDGEVIGQQGGAQWREVATADPIAVKGDGGITLIARTAFLGRAS